MKQLKLLSATISFLILISCSSPDSDSKLSVDGGFSLVNSPYHSSSRLDILYNENFSGQVSYIAVTTDLHITNANEFNTSSATKKTVTITPVDDYFNSMQLTPMLNYIAVSSLSAATKYYVYILVPRTGDLAALTGSTKASGTSQQLTYTVTGYAGDITCYLNFPDGYDESTATWPLVISVKAPDFTAADPNFPCITFNTDISWSTSTQFTADIAAVQAKIKEIVNDTGVRIDRSRIYACGFSAGGGVVMYLANNETAYEITALALNGVSDWAGSSSLYSGNLCDTDIWISAGANDPYSPWVCHKNMPKTGGDHFLSVFAGKGHDASLTWDSPYTLNWLLGK